MCTIMSNTGMCSRGENCSFAHSQAELAQHRQLDPNYKTAICRVWKQHGWCEKNDGCIFAHGPNELRPKGATNSTVNNNFSSYGVAFNGGYPQPASASKPTYKSAICPQLKEGKCEKEAAECSYAHSVNELAPGSTYKTVSQYRDVIR